MEILINSRFLKAKKAFLDGTHRLCSPEETLKNILKEKERIGLTRIADITGFDHIGIPVTAAIRPNSQTLSSSSGKGLTKVTALVSGIMEALELYQAENHRFDSICATVEELKNGAIPLEALSRRKNGIFPRNWPYEWCFGWDLITQRELAVPIMVVSMDINNMHTRYELDSFEVSSNGLASGNHILEAITSGIYEVIERDGVSCTGHKAPKVRLNTITSPVVQELIGKIHRAGVGLALYDCMTDTGVYIFKAHAYDRMIGLTGGYGAHLDPEVAMVRAITEAVQARAVYVSGSRDDIFQSVYHSFRKFNTQSTLDMIDTIEEVVDVSGYKSMATETFEEDIDLLLRKLKKIGIEHVLVFDLSVEGSLVSVCKIIIPGLEGYHSDSYQPGKRAFTSIPDEGLHNPAGAL